MFACYNVTYDNQSILINDDNIMLLVALIEITVYGDDVNVMLQYNNDEVILSNKTSLCHDS